MIICSAALLYILVLVTTSHRRRRTCSKRQSLSIPRLRPHMHSWPPARREIGGIIDPWKREKEPTHWQGKRWLLMKMTRSATTFSRTLIWSGASLIAQHFMLIDRLRLTRTMLRALLYQVHCWPTPVGRMRERPLWPKPSDSILMLPHGTTLRMAWC